MNAELPPIYAGDYIAWEVDGGYAFGEIEELHIPHPTNEHDNRQYIRVATSINSSALISTNQLALVLCPKCSMGYTLRNMSELTGGYLRPVQGEVTNIKTGRKQIRTYRYCDKCQYFKEAK